MKLIPKCETCDMRAIFWTATFWILLAATAYCDDRIGHSGIGGTLIVGESEKIALHENDRKNQSQYADRVRERAFARITYKQTVAVP
ncbi:MAG: hypothetical protein K2X38_23565 [Gemmataceae bacterium]|nr:hypothetical protein [Gemmataceae bacterium]